MASVPIVTRGQGGLRTAITPIVISHILKKTFGPDVNRQVGDRIYVVEPIPPDDTDFMDEPRLQQGTSPMVFLRQLHATLRGQRLYTFTYPFVSKWHIASDGHFTVMGLLTTKVAREIDSLNSIALSGLAVQRYGLGAVSGEEPLMRAILARRGIRSNADIAHFAQRLSLDPAGVAREAQRFDRVHPTRVAY
jgi:hypothetical protein